MAITRIAQVDVGAGGAASIDFTSIPSTFTDLMVVFSLRSTTNSVYPRLRFNGDTGSSNYTILRLTGDGSSAVSAGGAVDGIYLGNIPGSSETANTFGNSTAYIPNYGNSSAKAASVDSVSENNASGAFQDLRANRWVGTAAITSISIFSAANYAQYSSATLYGISKTGATGATVS